MPSEPRNLSSIAIGLLHRGYVRRPQQLGTVPTLYLGGKYLLAFIGMHRGM